MLCSQSIWSQYYNHSPSQTFISNAVLNDGNVYNIFQLHATQDTLHFKWKKLSVNVPTTWEVSICDLGHCYVNIPDSSTMDPVVVGDNGLMSLHLNPHNEEGTGIIKVLFWEIKSPTKIDTLTWKISATSLSNLNIVKSNYDVTIFPNPSNETLFINTPFSEGFEYKIIDGVGKTIFKSKALNSNISFQVNSFPIGNYQIIISDRFHYQFTISH